MECPKVQVNLSGSSFTARAAEKLRQGFPDFEATLGAGGSVRMTVRGTDKLSIPVETSVTWDVQVDALLYGK